jgi:hypothetical protein
VHNNTPRHHEAVMVLMDVTSLPQPGRRRSFSFIETSGVMMIVRRMMKFLPIMIFIVICRRHHRHEHFHVTMSAG